MNALEQAVADYTLTMNNVSFAVPYWINWHTDEFFFDAPYRGKGTPRQLRAALGRAITSEVKQPQTAEGYRRLMRRFRLGIDCSGFAYYLLQRHLHSKRLGSLSRYLMFSNTEIEAALQRHPERGFDVVGRDTITLEEVAHAWHRNPVAWTDVKRLTATHVTTVVSRARDIEPGDMIKLTGAGNQDHIAVVIRVAMDSITYAQSIYRAGTLGGVETQTIRIIEPEQGLEAQEWPDKHLYAHQ